MTPLSNFELWLLKGNFELNEFAALTRLEPYRIYSHMFDDITVTLLLASPDFDTVYVQLDTEKLYLLPEDPKEYKLAIQGKLSPIND